MGGLLPRSVGEKEQDKNDQNDQRADHQQCPGSRQEFFILPAPRDEISGREAEFRRDLLLRIVHKIGQGPVFHIGLHKDPHHAVLAGNHRWARRQSKISHHGEGDILPLHGGDEHLLQGGNISAQFPRVADSDRDALPSVDGCLKGGSTNGCFDGVVDLGRGDTVAGSVITAHGDVQIGCSRNTLGIDICRAGDLLQDPLHLQRKSFQLLEFGPEDLHGNLTPDAGIEHENPAFNGLQKGRNKSGKLLHLLQHLGLQFFHRHPGTPCGQRLEHDGGLDHRNRCRVGRSVGTAQLADHAFHLRERSEDFVLGRHDAVDFRHRGTGQRGRHVEQCPLVERRHEVPSDPPSKGQSSQEDHDGRHNHRFAMIERPLQNRPVKPEEEPQDGILPLVTQLAANKKRSQHRDHSEG